MKNSESGFIALMSVIIISALLMAVSFTLSMSGFFARANITDSEYKERSAALADGCADDALLRLAMDPSYAPINEPGTNIDCTIITIQNLSGKKRVLTKATVQDAVTNLEVIVTMNPISVVSWQELP